MKFNTSHTLTLLIRQMQVGSPQEAYQWNKISKRVLNCKLKTTNRALTVLFLRRCQRREVRCNDVEHFVKKIPSRFLRNKQRRSMMNNKLNDARFQEEKAKKKFLKEFNYLSRRWGVQNPYFMSQFNILMQREVEETWQDG